MTNLLERVRLTKESVDAWIAVERSGVDLPLPKHAVSLATMIDEISGRMMVNRFALDAALKREADVAKALEDAGAYLMDRSHADSIAHLAMLRDQAIWARDEALKDLKCARLRGDAFASTVDGAGDLIRAALVEMGASPDADLIAVARAVNEERNRQRAAYEKCFAHTEWLTAHLDAVAEAIGEPAFQGDLTVGTGLADRVRRTLTEVSETRDAFAAELRAIQTVLDRIDVKPVAASMSKRVKSLIDYFERVEKERGRVERNAWREREAQAVSERDAFAAELRAVQEILDANNLPPGIAPERVGELARRFDKMEQTAEDYAMRAGKMHGERDRALDDLAVAKQVEGVLGVLQMIAYFGSSDGEANAPNHMALTFALPEDARVKPDGCERPFDRFFVGLVRPGMKAPGELLVEIREAVESGLDTCGILDERALGSSIADDVRAINAAYRDLDIACDTAKCERNKAQDSADALAQRVRDLQSDLARETDRAEGNGKQEGRYRRALERMLREENDGHVPTMWVNLAREALGSAAQDPSGTLLDEVAKQLESLAAVDHGESRYEAEQMVRALLERFNKWRGVK